jgi:hypothetical protein
MPIGELAQQCEADLMALPQQINRPPRRPMLLYAGRALAAALGALGLGLFVLGLPAFAATFGSQ